MTEAAILDVLAGTPVADAATRAAIEPAALADAVRVYQAAGRAALRRQERTNGWVQRDIRFPSPDDAERTFVHDLAPVLDDIEGSGLLASWWYIRKPQWRLRCLTATQTPPGHLERRLDTILDTLAAQRRIDYWRATAYEPEAIAFGGPDGLAVAHNLFHRDSRHIADHLGRRDRSPAVLRLELSLLLCSAMMRAAGQDWYEQGDIWARVAANRRDHAISATERTAAAVRQLVTVDAGPASALVTSGSLRFAAGWVNAFNDAGRALRGLAEQGGLARGLRDVLGHHVLFHWNRIGVPAATQAAVACVAAQAVFGQSWTERPALSSSPIHSSISGDRPR